MKLPLFLCLALCLLGTSCERHKELQTEITALEANVKQDEAAIQQYEKDIAALGGTEALSRIVEQTQIKQDQIRPLEFVNAPRERKLSAIETELNALRPAADALKAAQTK